MTRAACFLVLALLGPSTTHAQQAPHRYLHAAARVRVKIAALDTSWIDGTVVEGVTSPGCLAVRLEHKDRAGNQQYAFLAAVTALRVDRRTNQGVITIGLPPPADSDWVEWSRQDIAAAAAV